MFEACLVLALSTLSTRGVEAPMAGAAPRVHPDFFLQGKFKGSGSLAYTSLFETGKILWWKSTELKQVELSISNVELALSHGIGRTFGGVGTASGSITFDGDVASSTEQSIVVSGVLTPNYANSGRIWVSKPQDDEVHPMFSLEASIHHFWNADGTDKLLVHANGRDLWLQKDATGNSAPVVKVVPPPGVTSWQLGAPYEFSASVQDAEDALFPATRIVWSVDPLAGDAAAHVAQGFVQQRGWKLSHEFLWAGKFLVTCQAYDQGGLRGWDQLLVEIVGEAPERPEILQPTPAGQYFAGAPIVFQGVAWDVEDFMLGDGHLRWLDLPDGSSQWVEFGGKKTFFTHELAAGKHAIRLFATDTTGLDSPFTEHTIEVKPYAGSSPPAVAITQPDLTRLRVPQISVHPDGGAILEARAVDLESPQSIKYTWFVMDVPTPGQPDPPLGPFKGTQQTFRLDYAESGLAPDAQLYVMKRIVVRATDASGLSATAEAYAVFWGGKFSIEPTYTNT